MRRALVAIALSLCVAAPCAAEPLTLSQVLQRVMDRDASLRIARMQVERAEQERYRVESQLGWVLSGEGGVARDVSQFGTPVERADAGASVERRLQSGSTVGAGAGVTREDSETTFSPLIPNPSQTTRFDLRYRLPLARGADNAEYHEGLEIADAGVELARADWDASRDQLAQRAVELFYSAALTQVRIRNAIEATERAERFKDYIARNARLGVAEAKDRLQAEAQLRARIAEHRSLNVAWQNQRTALNRLMERDWDREWEPVISQPPYTLSADLPALEMQAAANSPDLLRERARLRIAEATLERNRESGRDKADLVFSVGNRNIEGDVVGGTMDNSERVAALRFEYRAALDRRGADADVTQAYIDRAIAQQRIDSAQTELRYAVARLAAEIESATLALEEARERRAAERAKLDEALVRYRRGRTDTAQIIQFENDYEAAVLALEQQTIELARRRAELDIVRGHLWNSIALPPVDNAEANR